MQTRRTVSYKCEQIPDNSDNNLQYVSENEEPENIVKQILLEKKWDKNVSIKITGFSNTL